MGVGSGVDLRKLGVAVAAGVALVLVLAPAAQAVQFDVTRFDDPPTTGCNSGVDCSLREAVEDANATAVGDVVNVPAPPAGQTYELFGQISILEDLTITGAGATTTTVRQDGFGRVFEIGDFGQAAPEVEINNLTITGGQDSPGGGIQVVQGQLVLRRSVVTGNVAAGEGAGFGGGLAVRPAGTATIDETTFSNNSATGTFSEGGQGGAIWSDSPATLAISKSTIGPGNSAGGTPNVSGPAAGGGLSVQAGALSLLNVTVSGNAVTNGENGLGGGIFVDGGVTATVDSSTIAENTVAGNGATGGNIGRDGAASVALRQTLVAGGVAPAGANCSGPVATQGSNLESPSSQCGFNNAGDQTSVADPLLGPLADNEGPTFTHALLEGSPALDAVGGDCPPPDTDQRGVVRAQGPACDIGAFELQQPELVDPVVPEDICFGEKATIIGDKGDNVVTGTNGDDVIVSLTGADEIRGLEGDDLICARGTEDTLDGGPGDDRLRADGEDDKLHGGPGDDVLNGANDNDKLTGNAGNDKLHGGDSNDDLNGGKGNDSCWGSKGQHDHARQCEHVEGVP